MRDSDILSTLALLTKQQRHSVTDFMIGAAPKSALRAGQSWNPLNGLKDYRYLAFEIQAVWLIRLQTLLLLRGAPYRQRLLQRDHDQRVQ